MKKILIVVDMQNDFIDGSLATKEAQEIVDNVCNKIENADADIIVTYDTHSEDYLNTSEGAKLPVEHCIKGTEGWQLNKKVENALVGKNVRRVEKLTFGSKELPGIIENEYGKNTAIELVGLCTDICVVSNALLLKAYFPEVQISVDSSCCAGVTPEKHEAALETMRSCQIAVK